MKITYFLFLLMGVATSGYAQKFDLGKPSMAELQETQHPKDPSASAAVLFEKGVSKITYSDPKAL